MLILVKHLLAVARNDVAFVASLFKYEKPHFTVAHWNLEAPWKEKCYNRSSRAIDVHAVDLSIGIDVVDHFDLFPCQNLSLSLLRQEPKAERSSLASMST